MKVDGVSNNPAVTKSESGGVSESPPTGSSSPKGDSDSVVVTINGKNISQMSEFERKELPVRDKVVIEAIEKANKAILGANKEFHFSIHDSTKEIMVKILDKDSKEVVREIPSEKILDMVAKMWEMAGIVVDEKR